MNAIALPAVFQNAIGLPGANDNARIALAPVVEPKRPRPPAAGRAIVQRAALGKAVAAVNRVIERRNRIPILGNVDIAASGGVLILKATDLDIVIGAAVPCGIADDFEATMPAHLLDQIMKRGGASDEVAFVATADSEAANVGWGALNYKLNCLPPDDFPVMQPHGESIVHAFKMPGRVLFDMLDGTMAAVSTEETRYYLNGVMLHVHESGNRQELRTVATDGHRLYAMAHDMPAGAWGMQNAIIPRKAVEILHAMMKGKACPAEVAVNVSATHLVVTFDNLTVVSKLVDGTFPDYQRVIPTGNERVATFDCAAMVEAVKAVTVLSSERGRAVRISFEEGFAQLTVFDPEAGHAEMILDGVSFRERGETASPIEIGLNARYLLDILADAGAGEITCELRDAGSPAIFRGARRDWFAVQMPMRI